MVLQTIIYEIVYRGVFPLLQHKQRFASAAQRSRRLARTEAVGTSQKTASETVERPKARVAPHAYAMKAREEPDLEIEEAAWESEEKMRQQFPQLFTSGKFRGRNFILEGKSYSSPNL